MELINQHLPILQIVVPLIAAPLCIILRRRQLVWVFAVVVTWACLAMAGGLMLQVLSQGPISYHLGGWEPPWGIEYRVDAVN